MPRIYLISCAVLLLVVAGCMPTFRPEPEILEYPRSVVVRERLLLSERLDNLMRRIDALEQDPRSDADDTALLRIRRGRMDRVLHMLSFKLQEEGRVITFTRQQWRQAYNVGCRFSR